MASSAEKPSSRKWSSASRRRMPFFATMPITMIMPMKEATLNVVRVTRSASKPPKVESNAEARMGAGAKKGGSVNNSTTKNHKRVRENTTARVWDHYVGARYIAPT